MIDWNECKLGDIVVKTIDNRGKNPPYSLLGHEVIETSSISGLNKYPNYSVVKKYVSQDCYDNWFRAGHPQNGDIVIITVGNGIGNVCIMNSERGVLTQNLIGLRFNQTIVNSDYIYYYLSWSPIQDYLKGLDIGSAQPSIKVPHLLNTIIPMPSLPEQCAIAGVLSSLDDKIELLHRQNKTLERMAEALWRKMFVEGAEAVWEVGKLGDIAIVQNGFAFKSSEYVAFADGYLEVLKMGHIQPGGGLRTNPKTDFVPRDDRLARYILSKGDIVMAMTDMKDNVVILGNPAMIDMDDKYVLNQRVARIYLKTNDKLIDSHLLYVQLKDPEFISILQSKANSGVQVNLSTESIKDCDILIPPIDMQREKGGTIIEAYLKKENNDYQIRTISHLRDTLLPKLMSGEVRVKL